MGPWRLLGAQHHLQPTLQVRKLRLQLRGILGVGGGSGEKQHLCMPCRSLQDRVWLLREGHGLPHAHLRIQRERHRASRGVGWAARVTCAGPEPRSREDLALGLVARIRHGHAEASLESPLS